MSFKILDVVVLERDLPGDGLCRGDLGTIVEIYPPDGFDVEFVTAAGKTQALTTLHAADFRPVGDGDLVSVRKVA